MEPFGCQGWDKQTSRHDHLPLCTGKGTKRLLSQAGSDPRKLVAGLEPAGALIILLDTRPVGQYGAFSLSFHMSLSLGRLGRDR